MAIILKNGAVFLHIPKTGGNWVTEILEELDLVSGRVGIKHADIEHYHAPQLTSKATIKKAAKGLFVTPPKKPFMFCFVRNPLKWYESWFKYMEQPSRRWRHFGDENYSSKWHPNMILNGLGNNDFNKFVDNVNKKRPGYVTELFGWYTTPQIDFVGKQENLVEDLITVLQLMNLDFDADLVRNYDKVGVSLKPENAIVWDQHLKLETTLNEYAGIKRYGYDSYLKETGLDNLISRLVES